MMRLPPWRRHDPRPRDASGAFARHESGPQSPLDNPWMSHGGTWRDRRRSAGPLAVVDNRRPGATPRPHAVPLQGPHNGPHLGKMYSPVTEFSTYQQALLLLLLLFHEDRRREEEGYISTYVDRSSKRTMPSRMSQDGTRGRRKVAGRSGLPARCRPGAAARDSTAEHCGARRGAGAGTGTPDRGPGRRNGSTAVDAARRPRRAASVTQRRQRNRVPVLRGGARNPGAVTGETTSCRPPAGRRRRRAKSVTRSRLVPGSARGFWVAGVSGGPYNDADSEVSRLRGPVPCCGQACLYRLPRGEVLA